MKKQKQLKKQEYKILLVEDGSIDNAPKVFGEVKLWR